MPVVEQKQDSRRDPRRRRGARGQPEQQAVPAVPQRGPDRFLGTVLFVDVAGSTRLAAEIGDSRFRDLIDGFISWSAGNWTATRAGWWTPRATAH
jgi:class 3 adenylate cyclase